MAELDRLDREFGLGAMPTLTAIRASRRRRFLGPTLTTALVTAVLLGGLVAWSPDGSMDAVRRGIGLGPEADDRGEYAFLKIRPGTDEPVGYDPCQVIEIEVSTEGAPPNWSNLVDTAIDHAEDATGLDLELVGTTERRAFGGVAPTVVDSPPVLVTWATEDEFPELAGAVAGMAGSRAMDDGSGPHYVTGSVVLDVDAFDEVDDLSHAQAIVDHEFGHLLGLDHVDDPDELMYPETIDQRAYGPGDLAGLARLGSIAC